MLQPICATCISEWGGALLDRALSDPATRYPALAFTIVLFFSLGLALGRTWGISPRLKEDQSKHG